MNGNTYTLVHKDIRANIRIEILTSEYLTDIDAFTTDYASEFGLWEALEENSLGITSEDFTIEHKRGKRVYELPVVYGDQKDLKQFSQNNQGSSNVKNDIDHTIFVLELIKRIAEDQELVEYLSEKKHITQVARTYLNNYLAYKSIDTPSCQEESRHYWSLLSKYFTNYAHIRNIVIGIKAYEEKDIEFEEPRREEKPKVLKKTPAPAPKQLTLFDLDKF